MKRKRRLHCAACKATTATAEDRKLFAWKGLWYCKQHKPEEKVQ